MFVPSSQINNNFHTASPDGNSSITATSTNSTLESLQHSMENVDGCHDYRYEELFLEKVAKQPCLWNGWWPSYNERNTKANAQENIAATFGKDDKINYLVNTCFNAQYF